MKNYLARAMLFILLLGLLWICVACTNVKYPAGIDTKKSYGDGTFQLLSSAEHDALSYEKYGSIILENVISVSETNGKLYVIGSEMQGFSAQYHYIVYIVADLRNNTMQICPIAEEVYDRSFYTYRLDEMIENGDVLCYASLDDFTVEDYQALAKMQ